jgi:hypothetical protein
MMALKKAANVFPLRLSDKKKPRSFGGRGSFCSMFPSARTSSGPRQYYDDDNDDQDARDNLTDHESSPAVKNEAPYAIKPDSCQAIFIFCLEACCLRLVAAGLRPARA